MMPENRRKEILVHRFLETRDIPVQEFKAEPFAMVIFGGTGDLSKRKLLPALFHLYQDHELSKGFSIIGFARSIMTEEQYRHMIKEAIKEFAGGTFDENQWDEFSSRLFYLSGGYEEDGSYVKLCEKINQVICPTAEEGKDVIHYMALPPEITPMVVERLKNRHLCRERFNTKIVVEKPFGRDRLSAAQLNKILTDAFHERQIYRMDHYLGKETVQNIAFLRFSNSIFEQLWNERCIDHVQITVAEDLGIEHRSAFYEQSGVIRDIVQNHILQLIGLVAMEPPIGFEAEAIRDEKGKVFRSIAPMDDEYIDQFMVRGQYGQGKVKGQDVPGYREEDGIASDSNTATFFAGKFYIENWRWAGVPFYIRTGKRMTKRITEIAVEFRQPPLRLFGQTSDALAPNTLLLTIQPDEKVSLRFNVKYPYTIGKICSANMVLDYKETFKTKPHSPYERLLIDCIKGDLTLFARQDGIEAMWEVVDPILARWESIIPYNLPNYPAGSWGPTEADLMIQREGRHWITT